MRTQFFITLDKSPWLERKHTIFGKVRAQSAACLVPMTHCCALL